MSGEPETKSKGGLMNVLSLLIAAAALVFAVSSHSTDNTSQLEQRVSANEAAIKAQGEQAHQDHIETQRRLDTMDGRDIDMYRVLLQMQQHMDDQEAKRK